ncbi:PREDICTED: protein timeless homolog isoform X1 [Brassica oleracea var. oleracea]|uniref:Timeless N-terminal domain-containing protein n=1 Tax=Brassica oleracea var. oleracea TaxID=109376 RepID=A0A0D3EAH5_BRAOL|nr:PREDICTED: protein timeless homolog isoform X1 [Brassica oleracea var. oleracea]
MDTEERTSTKTKKKMDLEGLSVICSDLGEPEEDGEGRRIGYSKSDYCLDNLKDLLRFLRRDDPQSRDVFKQVCAWNIVSKDLIPIIEHYQDEHSLVLNAVKVLVFLTMPVESDSDDVPQQIEYLWGLKSAFTVSNNIVAVVVSLLETPLENLELDDFNEEDWKLVQLVLTLFRNLLAIHDISPLQKAGESTCYFLSLRDQFLELLSRENVMDIFIVLTQTIECNNLLRHDNLLLLEIYHYILLGQDMELIALAPEKLDQGKKAAVESLKKLMEAEEAKRKLARLNNANQRHSQFGGTFTRVTMGGTKAVLTGIPSNEESTLLKPHISGGAREKIVWEHGSIPVTNDNVLKLLHDFINQFMSGGYNVLMQSVCEDIEKEHPSVQNSDIVTFFQVAQAVTSFQFHKSLASTPARDTEETPELSTNQNTGGNFSKSDICAPIAATINDRMFSLVISKWRTAFDGLKETKDFKFLSAAGSLVKIMLCLLDLVIKLRPEDSREAFTVRILLYKLFYDQTDQGMCQFILNLVRSFDTHKQPKSELGDLVESIHIIVGLMENLQGRGTLRVSKKLRKARKKKPMGNKEATLHEPSENHPSTSNQDSTAKTIPVVDSTVPIEDGPPNNPGDSNLGTEADETPQTHGPKSNHVVDDMSCGTDDSSDGEDQTATDEVDFKVSTFISAFANNSIIQNICWLLKFYRSNTKQTNHHVISILRRITEDLELSPMLYQLSLLITFHKILDEQKACPSKDYENIVTFLTDLVRNMLKKMKSQPLLFVEILFPKSRKECHYINAEYMLHELGHLRKQMGNQEKASGTQENVSSSDKGWARRNIADALGDDEADVVISYDQGFQNEDDHIVENESAGPSKRKRRLVLDADMETKIRDLYERFKDDKDCSRLIAETLDPDGGISAAQVTNKLKQLGLETRKRLRRGTNSMEASKGSNGNDDPDHVEAASDQKPSDSRKRVSSFSKEQETLIKELYEKFKDERRCCYLIANELGSENTYTTGQVSRKLKQLGLRLPRGKKSEAGMKLQDDHDDSSADESDNETLLAFKKRKSMTRRKLEKHTRPSNEISPEGSEDKTERNETSPDVIATSKEEDSGHDYITGKSRESDTYVLISENGPSASSPEDQNLFSDHELEDDELADSGDDSEAGGASLTQSPLSRRKLKMVLDLDDEDD